jgi:hypothetical protein
LGIDVHRCGIAEIIENANLAELRREFAAEVATCVQPSEINRLYGYQTMERDGTVQAIGAFQDGMVIGFITVLTPGTPRLGTPVAAADGLFVGRQYRDTGAGLKLLKAAENYAAEIGSPVLLCGSLRDGPLSKILPRLGYVETNVVYSKELRHG